MEKNIFLNPTIEKKVSLMFKTISDPTRIKIIYALRGEPLSVGQIVSKLNMTQSAVSHQLRVLRDVNLVGYEKKGKEVFYSLSDHHVYTIFDQVIEHVLEEKI